MFQEWPTKDAIVIGSGISGLLAARLLADDHAIHAFEANQCAGSRSR